MFAAVSTIKDTLPNAQRYVRENLANGVDHLFVYLDDDAPDVRGFLEQHDHVTVVRTDPTWWHGKRPHQLNVRQRINANVTRTLLAPFPEVAWLLHLDGDECAVVDRAQLRAVAGDVDALRLRPLEAVSRRRGRGSVTEFKRLLEPDDLTLLQVLGVIDEPENEAYFRGHVYGKSALRPRLDRWLSLHDVRRADRTVVRALESPWLRLLHHESTSRQEFVRKWTTLLDSGPKLSVRDTRNPTVTALRTLIGKELSEKQAEKYLSRIYERTTEDDVGTLRDLGMLEQIDPLAGAHQPATLPTGLAEQLGILLERLRDLPKWPFHTGETQHEAAEVVARAAADLAGSEPDLSRAVLATIPADLPRDSETGSRQGDLVVADPDGEPVVEQGLEAPDPL